MRFRRTKNEPKTWIDTWFEGKYSNLQAFQLHCAGIGFTHVYNFNDNPECPVFTFSHDSSLMVGFKILNGKSLVVWYRHDSQESSFCSLDEFLKIELDKTEQGSFVYTCKRWRRGKEDTVDLNDVVRSLEDAQKKTLEVLKQYA